ncbi:hypothetical protein D9Q98_009065 [Chlorella vulgaris]|uniref:Apple domain-containing protein n=1 Tax=Chlorella vulgaris TaxID=3077 RepID=A0A9D4TH44_CHLVU|nr:hypothetical protein D9Q98_009065 [Chlorella vulgaris]
MTLKALTLLALVLLVPLAACRPISVVPVTTRALPSARGIMIMAERQLGSSTTGVWQNFTREADTFYLGPVLVDASTADSDETCAQRCNDSPVCNWWAFCAQSQGCPFLNYCDITANATSQQVISGSCLQSTEETSERQATNIIFADSSDSNFGWISGVYDPVTTATARRATTGSTSTISKSLGSGARRKLQQLPDAATAASGNSVFQLPGSSPSSSLPGASVWDYYTNAPKTFLRGSAVLPVTSADSAEECATQCLDDAKCVVWAWCPSDTSSAGCEALEWCTPQDAADISMPASTCLLSHDTAPARTEFVRILGDGNTGLLRQLGVCLRRWLQDGDSPTFTDATTLFPTCTYRTGRN